MSIDTLLQSLNPVAPVANVAGEAAAGLFSKGGQAVTTGPTDVSTRNAVNIAPVGFNLGAIMQPYQAGSSVNGGFPLDVSTPTTNFTQKEATPGLFNNPLLIGAIAASGLLLIVLLRR